MNFKPLQNPLRFPPCVFLIPKIVRRTGLSKVTAKSRSVPQSRAWATCTDPKTITSQENDSIMILIRV